MVAPVPAKVDQRAGHDQRVTTTHLLVGSPQRTCLLVSLHAPFGWVTTIHPKIRFYTKIHPQKGFFIHEIKNSHRNTTIMIFYSEMRFFILQNI